MTPTAETANGVLTDSMLEQFQSRSAMAILFLRSVRRQLFSKTAAIVLSAVIASAVLGLIAIPASAENVTVVGRPTVEIVNAGFAAPVPDQVTVVGPMAFDPAWPDQTWTKWGDSGDNFTDVGCIDWFFCWGFPIVVPGWEFTGEVLYMDFFDGTFASDGQGNYSHSQNVNLMADTRLWQVIDNPAGAVVFRLEYAWVPYFGNSGAADVYFDGTLLATHRGSLSASGESDYVYTGLNYNWWADATDFIFEPTGQGIFNWQLEEQIIVTAEVLSEVSIAFKGTERSPFGFFGDPGGGIFLDYANLYAPATVRICHGSDGHNPRTIEVANGQSVLNHLSNINHGDYLGACGD